MAMGNIPVFAAQGIHPDSWLNDQQYAEFRKAYSYAATQTLAIPALAILSAEAVYHLWLALNQGAGRDNEVA